MAYQLNYVIYIWPPYTTWLSLHEMKVKSLIFQKYTCLQADTNAFTPHTFDQMLFSREKREVSFGVAGNKYKGQGSKTPVVAQALPLLCQACLSLGAST